MAAISVNAQEIMKDYVARLGKILPIERAILFGSHAKGTADESSDIDIAIISPTFTDMPRVDSFVLLMREARSLKVDIQPLPFAPDDLAEPTGILEEILRTGMDIVIG